MDDSSIESIDAKEEEEVQDEKVNDNLSDEMDERSLIDRAVDSLNQLCASFEDICASRLDQFQTRLATSQARLPHIRSCLQQQQDTIASLELQLRESAAKCKSWQQKWSKEKEDRRMEKEWMADIWPDFVVVPPTILKPFMKEMSEEEKQKRNEAARMKMRLDEEALRVQERMAHAKQWTFVDNYYYNATTGESSWEMPPVMAYVPPQGWDIAKNQWKDGVVLTLPEDFQSLPPRNADTDENVVSARSDSGGSDSAVDDQLDPIDLRAQVTAEQSMLEKLNKEAAASKLRLETLSHQLQKAVERQITDEESQIQAAYNALVEEEKKRRMKEARERQAAAMEAKAKLEKEEGKSKAPKKKLQNADMKLDVDLENIQIPVDDSQPRLCSPLTNVPSVRMHLKTDEAYQHMQTVRIKVDAHVKREDLLWEAHDNFRESIEKEIQAAQTALESTIQDLDRSKEMLETSKAEFERIKEAPPMPQLHSVPDVEGRTQFEVYDELMREWEENEVRRRVDIEELTETIAQMEHRLATTTLDRMRDDIAFLQEILKCEIERGAGLWSKKREYEVWRTKTMLDRVDRDEQLVQLRLNLQGYTAEWEHCDRIPLQAINTLERQRLHTQAEQRREHFAAKIETALELIQSAETAQRKLIQMELDALEFHHLRVEEEQVLHQETKGVWLQQKVTEDRTQQRILRSWLVLNYAREKRWRLLVSYDQIDESPWLAQEEWLVSQLRSRHEAELAAIEEKYEVHVYELEQEIAKLEVQVQIAKQGKVQSDADKAMVMTIVNEADTLVEATKAETILCLKRQMDELILKMEAQEKQHEERIDRLLAEHAVIREDLEKRLEVTAADAILRMQWLKAVKCELSDHKVLNKHLLCGIAALEKRRATEINDMQARISSQLSRIHRLEMWNMSLKQSIEANNDVLLQHQRKLEGKVREHRAEQRILRHEVWRQRISAQLLLTNAHHLVLFFLQGIAGLCGHANDALRDAAVIPILVELCKIPSLPAEIRALATSSLGKLGWNTPKSLRYIGWQAKTVWTNWVHRLSKEASHALQESKAEFDDPVGATSSEMNLSADSTNHEKFQTHLDRLHILRETQHWVSQSEIPNTINETNILAIGDTSGALAILVGLSGNSSAPLDIQEGALASLATLAMHTRNIHLIGRFPGFLAQLVALAETAPSRLMQVHALHSLANLSFQNKAHQEVLHGLDIIAVLVRVATTSRDVDALDMATAALANLTESHQAMILQLVACGGLAQLLTLSMAPYLSDAVEDGKMDAIQGNISLCVVHILHANPESVVAVWREKPAYLDLCLNLLESGFASVQAAAIMVLGVVSQDDAIRGHLGDVGVIDLLLPFLDVHDLVMVEQTSWTLLQLSWNRDNQTRLSLHGSTWFSICAKPDPAWRLVQQYIFQLVGNLVFYHPENRLDMIADPNWVKFLLETCQNHQVSWRADAVRAMCALSYENAFAAASHHMPILVDVLGASDATDMVLNALQWLKNLLVHDVQKSRFVHCPQATETLVALCGAESPQIRERAKEALDLVADVRVRSTAWKL